MDIKSILSGGGSADKRLQQLQSQEAVRKSAPQATTPLSTTSSFGPVSQPATPLFAPGQVGGAIRPPYSAGTAPITTPSQVPGQAQYPFPPQPVQSPVIGSQMQHFRPSDGLQAGPRPTSRGNQFAPPPALHHQASSGMGSVHSRMTSSHSPTPPSHLNQPSQPLRQSPYGSGVSQSSHMQYQTSQPNTPVVPPALYPQRSGTLNEMPSPLHHRTGSGASNGIMPGSPAHPHLQSNHAMPSPGLYAASSPHPSRSSDYLPPTERERSMSVSPKTMIPPRPPSMGSRHSSQHDIRSARNSLPMNATAPSASPDQMMHNQRTMPAAVQPYFAGEVSQPSPNQMGSSSGLPGGIVGGTGISPSMSAKASPQPVSHHAQKMGMNHLLTPTAEVPPPIANGDGLPRADMRAMDYQSTPSKLNPSMSRPGMSTTPSTEVYQGSPAKGSSVTSRSPSQTQSAREVHSATHNQQDSSRALESAAPAIATKGPLKRPAEGDHVGNASKQRRVRKYSAPPPWAQYSKHNPRFQNQQHLPRKAPVARTPPQQTRSMAHANGGFVKAVDPPFNDSHNNIPDDRPPWLHSPPLDFDLVNARKLLGPWEKTFMWNTPYPDMLRAVQDWVFVTLDGLQDVGWNARDGAVEIEAKIGTLLDRDDSRCKLPVSTATLINPMANKNFHFESQMTEAEHKTMNDFLNGAIRDTMQKGRVPMSYQHIYELDSFRDLSPAGLRAIPAALQSRQKRVPKLRTTTELDKTGRAKGMKARIVKINIDNIHIFNPMHRYDCRISINLEVNLDQPDLDPNDLILEPTDAKPTEPNRNKDRMSYKHLAYSVDLTKVIIDGMAPKHELELEVDAKLLREHHRLLKAGQPNAFADILSGFLDNATFLMRQRASG